MVPTCKGALHMLGRCLRTPVNGTIGVKDSGAEIDWATDVQSGPKTHCTLLREAVKGIKSLLEFGEGEWENRLEEASKAGVKLRLHDQSAGTIGTRCFPDVCRESHARSAREVDQEILDEEKARVGDLLDAWKEAIARSASGTEAHGIVQEIKETLAELRGVDGVKDSVSEYLFSE